MSRKSPPVLLRPLLFTGFLALTTGMSVAQTVPDAGQLLREQPRAPVAPPTKPLEIAPDRPTEAGADTGLRILVKGFNIKGAVLLSEAELQTRLQFAIGQELSLRQLQDLARQLIAHYAERGYLARIVLPPQDIKDGIVTIQIIEGRRGSLQIESQDSGIDAARIQRFIDARIDAGESMNINHLGEALANLNEQPGISVRAALKPGRGEGDVDLVVQAAATSPVDYFLGANNHGPRATGEWQATAGATLNNPSGNFDSLTIQANSADGVGFGRLDYTLALGDRGMRAGVHASRLNYRITQSDLAALHAHGTADSHGASVSYPLVNQPQLTLRLEYKLEEKRLIDRTEVGETGNRRVTTHTAGIGGHIVGAPDNLLGAGILSFNTAIVSGTTEQKNETARDLDALTRHSTGQFAKLTYQLGYLLPLSGNWSLNASLRGQFANKNLDSSERISLGGPGGVRAYPVAEATGDEGSVASVSLDHKLQDNLSARLFLDAGSVTINHNTWAGWNAGAPNQLNRHDLLGAGLGLDWRIAKEALLSLIIATPLGNNPGRDAQGRNNDGSAPNARGWLNLVVRF